MNDYDDLARKALAGLHTVMTQLDRCAAEAEPLRFGSPLQRELAEALQAAADALAELDGPACGLHLRRAQELALIIEAEMTAGHVQAH